MDEADLEEVAPRWLFETPSYVTAARYERVIYAPLDINVSRVLSHIALIKPHLIYLYKPMLTLVH